MLTAMGATFTIGRGPGAAAGDPIDAMVDCHARIRRFADLAVELAGAGVAPDARRTAAADVARYFGEGLPRHQADEELALEPALRARDADPALAALLDELADQHRAIDAAVDALLPRWCALAAGAADDLAALGADAVALRERLAAHLAREEAALFPRARVALDADARAALAAAIRARRADPR
jgi:hemerythrin-like domain-containing protein